MNAVTEVMEQLRKALEERDEARQERERLLDREAFLESYSETLQGYQTDLARMLKAVCAERDRLQRERDEARAEAARRLDELNMVQSHATLAMRDRDEARAEVGRCRLRIESDGYAWIPGDGSAESRISPVEAAYRRGAEAMREAAHQACLRVSRSESYYSPNVGDECADAVRALPIPEER